MVEKKVQDIKDGTNGKDVEDGKAATHGSFSQFPRHFSLSSFPPPQTRSPRRPLSYNFKHFHRNLSSIGRVFAVCSVSPRCPW